MVLLATAIPTSIHSKNAISPRLVSCIHIIASNVFLTTKMTKLSRDLFIPLNSTNNFLTKCVIMHVILYEADESFKIKANGSYKRFNINKLLEESSRW